MENIEVFVNKEKAGNLFFEKELNQYGFNYIKEELPISMIMPYKASTYIWKYKLHPIFDMNMPEGYLFEIFKKYLTKEYGYIDDFLIFSHLCPNIQSRLTFKSQTESEEFSSLNLNEVLENDTPDTFTKILHTFLNKNAISGVQPKSLALLKDKETLSTKEYIVKAFGDEYPQLALNEYFCLKAIQKAGVKIPSLLLSKNNRFLVVEKFNYEKESDNFLGFEEILILLGKNKEEKYSGSYEQIIKIVYNISTNKYQSMIDLYKLIVMNYLLKNGDAHLKNFGVLYNKDFSNIEFAPAYDVVNTCVYFHKDKPALTMFGKKLWFGKKELIMFGVQNCKFNTSEATKLYEECIEALRSSIDELKDFLYSNKDFETVGQMMIDSWKYSLNQNTHKEIPLEIRRNWSNY